MPTANRLDRRRERTRAALVSAAQTFLAEGRVTASVLEITRAADVGMGSFYNHFESKDHLFQTAVNDVLDDLAQHLDSLTDGMDDPVEKFTQSFRLTGRLFRFRPVPARVVLNAGSELKTTERGFVPRCTRDITDAAALGRFDVDDPPLAMAMVAGSMFAMGRLLLAEPERDGAATVDRLAADILRAFGVPPGDVRELCSRSLPSLVLGQ